MSITLHEDSSHQTCLSAHLIDPFSLARFFFVPPPGLNHAKPPPVTEIFASEVTLPSQMSSTLLRVQTSDASNPHSYSCLLTMQIHPEPRLCKSVTTHIHIDADAVLVFVPSRLNIFPCIL